MFLDDFFNFIYRPSFVLDALVSVRVIMYVIYVVDCSTGSICCVRGWLLGGYVVISAILVLVSFESELLLLPLKIVTLVKNFCVCLPSFCPRITCNWFTYKRIVVDKLGEDLSVCLV